MELANEKLGRVAIITENNTICEFGKDYIVSYIFKKLEETWEVDLLLINEVGEKVSNGLKECNPKLFTYSKSEPKNLNIPSAIITEGLKYNSEIAKASSLFYYLHSHPSLYEAYVFVGLSLSTISLLPFTKKRNCLIPLLYPRELSHYFNNQAFVYALIACDYFFCHSQKEAEAVRKIQPHAEIRTFPIMTDISFVKENIKNPKIVKIENECALLIAEKYDATISYFYKKLQKNFDNVLLLIGQKQSLPDEKLHIISFNDFVHNFDNLISKLKAALVFMNRDFFPIIYNIAQYGVPLFISTLYPWQDFIDGNNLNFLSFNEEINPDTAKDSLGILPQGYHHYSFYTNYLLRYINEWCIDNKLRCEKLEAKK